MGKWKLVSCVGCGRRDGTFQQKASVGGDVVFPTN